MGGSYKKSLPWGRYGYFVDLHIVRDMKKFSSDMLNFDIIMTCPWGKHIFLVEEIQTQLKIDSNCRLRIKIFLLVTKENVILTE